jgi:hypothetical protein
VAWEVMPLFIPMARFVELSLQRVQIHLGMVERCQSNIWVAHRAVELFSKPLLLQRATLWVGTERMLHTMEMSLRLKMEGQIPLRCRRKFKEELQQIRMGVSGIQGLVLF